ncbi:MAG: hypothetical protein R3B96_16420 [Pirellulaceae bacterium]
MAYFMNTPEDEQAMLAAIGVEQNRESLRFDSSGAQAVATVGDSRGDERN